MSKVTVASLKISLAQEIEAKNLALKEIEVLKAELREAREQLEALAVAPEMEAARELHLPDWGQALVNLGFSLVGVESIVTKVECKENAKYWILMTDARTQSRIASKLDELKVQKWCQIENGKHKVNFLK